MPEHILFLGGGCNISNLLRSNPRQEHTGVGGGAEHRNMPFAEEFDTVRRMAADEPVKKHASAEVFMTAAALHSSTHCLSALR